MSGRYLDRRSATHLHRGVDFDVPVGTPFFAPEHGWVERIVEPNTIGFRGYGRAIVLRVPNWPVEGKNYYLLFAHLDKVVVKEGQRVRPTDLLGTTGRTGIKRTGPELHFEVAEHPYPMDREAARVDPVAWLAEGRVHPIGRRLATRKQFPRARGPSTGALPLVAAVLLGTAAVVIAVSAA